MVWSDLSAQRVSCSLGQRERKKFDRFVDPNVQGAEYIRIHESIVIGLFLRLIVHKVGTYVTRFYMENPNSKCPVYNSKRIKETSSMYLRRVFLPPPLPVLTNIHSIFAYDVPGTEDVGLPTKFRFNVGPALKPIAGSMPVNRLRYWPSTNLPPGLLYTLCKHVTFNQCCFNVDPHSSTLARHWNGIG